MTILIDDVNVTHDQTKSSVEFSVCGKNVQKFRGKRLQSTELLTSQNCTKCIITAAALER